MGNASGEVVTELLESSADEETFERTDAAYDPEFLDNPELRSGRHRTVINLTSYMVLSSLPLSLPVALIMTGLNQPFYQG